MCTYLTSTVAVSGSGFTADDWFSVSEAVVYFDHPQDAPVDHALCIDVRSAQAGDRPGERVALELDAESATRLAHAILETLEHRDAQAVLTIPS